MDILKTLQIQPGVYVAAISGGVDSMVLLHLLSQIKSTDQGYKFIIAHFDHGIREDSIEDRLHVAEVAQNYGLPFVYSEGNLGPETSEAAARHARYEFLERVKEKSEAHAIITAHHLDDVIETATHNILRGTGRKGVTSLSSRPGTIRPLLHLPKNKLVAHAKTNNLTWREDSTNMNLKYRRNFIRHVILPDLKQNYPEKYKKLQLLVKRQYELNKAIDEKLGLILHLQPQAHALSRHEITMLPHAVARETVAHWLRNNGARDFTRPIIERLTVMVKAAKPHTIMVINKQFSVNFDVKQASLKRH